MAFFFICSSRPCFTMRRELWIICHFNLHLHSPQKSYLKNYLTFVFLSALKGTFTKENILIELKLEFFFPTKIENEMRKWRTFIWMWIFGLSKNFISFDFSWILWSFKKVYFTDYVKKNIMKYYYCTAMNFWLQYLRNSMDIG